MLILTQKKKPAYLVAADLRGLRNHHLPLTGKELVVNRDVFRMGEMQSNISFFSRATQQDGT